ncbi:MAG: phosphate uptake regulator PhoU [Candidatus Helarchaeota archaeon]|nr:phosphate uptake regulator PhoU [Candidatus Helarchaeota archaeon]
MEVRKIQNTASGSFFITLPKPWVTNQDLKKGEKLVFSVEEDGALRVNPLKLQKIYYSEFIVQLEDYPEKKSLERAIKSSYIQGADVIVILSKNTILVEKKILIELATANLIGTEVSEEFSNKITIRILVDPTKFPLHILIRRIYMLVNSMHVDAMKSFNESDEILAKDVINREKQVDKLYFLMLRQLNLSLSNRVNFDEICASSVKIDCVLGIVLARDLSKMAHYAVEIAKQSLKLVEKRINPELKEHLVKMSKFIIKMQQNAILAFFKNDFMRANRIINDVDTISEYHFQTENEILKKITDSSTILSLTTIGRNLKNIAKCAIEVSEDLQVKHRPKTILRRELGSDILLEPLELV